MALAWPHCVPLESPNLTEAALYTFELSRATLDHSLLALERARLDYVQSQAHYFTSFSSVSGRVDAAVLALAQPPPPVAPKTVLDVLLIWGQLGARLLGLGLFVVWLATQLVDLWVAVLALRLAFSYEEWWRLWQRARLPTEGAWPRRVYTLNSILGSLYAFRLVVRLGLGWDFLPWPPLVRPAWHALRCVLEWLELGRLTLAWELSAETYQELERSPYRRAWHLAAGVWANVLFLVLEHVVLWLLHV